VKFGNCFEYQPDLSSEKLRIEFVSTILDVHEQTVSQSIKYRDLQYQIRWSAFFCRRLCRCSGPLL